ncbi:MAG: SpoIIE family protein phosphatase [Frankiales bacterium]|nr:SpoIIE family protein phosphatase [Frankiales bacterium]
MEPGGVSLRTRMTLLAVAGLVAVVVVGLLVRAAYLDVSTATRAVQNASPGDREAAIDALAGVARRMTVDLAVAGVVILAVLVSAYVLVRSWVLTPLDDLRHQLQGVARDGRRDQVIVPSGPPELRAVGRDAEAMRRALVVETDSARAAEGSLALEGPVVSAIRRELDVDPSPEVPHLEVHGRLRPAEGVLAGDWWGVVPLEDDRTALLVVDVSGHGAVAGVISLRLRAVLSVSLRSGFDPGTALARAATSFVDDDGRFATALVVVLDPRRGTLQWANAGHPAGWLLPGGRAGERLVLTQTGPLASALGGSWETRRAPLHVGDVLLVWSDGLVETRDEADEVVDAELAELVGAVEDEAPAELVTRMLAALREASPEWSRDDVTLVAVRRTS